MSFPRVKPSGYATHDQITQAEFNQLDIDHSNALDKSAAGDAIVGAITMGGVASLSASTSGAAIKATVAGSKIAASGGGTIRSETAGAIVLAGGASDWPTFSATRTRTVKRPAFGQGVGWLFSSTVAVGPATSSPLCIPINSPHDGATLTSVTMYAIPNLSHAGVPAVLPKIRVLRRAFTGVAPVSDLYSGTYVTFSPAPATAAAWENGGTVQSWTVTCDQNNVIDAANYLYYIDLYDENGTNSVTSALYPGYSLVYSSIGDMRFQ